MNITVQMLIRNEVDIIQETLWEITRWGLDDIVILDGQSNDGTQDQILEFVNKNPNVSVDFFSEPDPGEKFLDITRNRLMELTLEHKPDWIISVDADEIYETSPVDAVMQADKAGANVVRCHVPQFWITLADIRNGILMEDERQSIQDRRLWYSWGHMGTFIWKANHEHYYPSDVSKRTPELHGQTWRDWQIAGPVTPICKHYCFRTLQQGLKRAEERRVRGGRKCFGKYFQNWIIDEVAAGLRKYDGKEWDTRRTHDFVHKYMAGEI